MRAKKFLNTGKTICVMFISVCMKVFANAKQTSLDVVYCKYVNARLVVLSSKHVGHEDNYI